MVSEQNKIVLQMGPAALYEFRVYDEDGEWYAGSNQLDEALRYVEPGYSLVAVFEVPIHVGADGTEALDTEALWQ